MENSLLNPIIHNIKLRAKAMRIYSGLANTRVPLKFGKVPKVSGRTANGVVFLYID